MSNPHPASALRKPQWLKAPLAGGPEYARLRSLVSEHRLHTVCQSANCPNMGECWARGTATFMILGNTCTRGCRFCDVPKGRPGEYDRDEPQRVAESVHIMGLRYVVLTSVTRDDLPDQGAEVWAETVRQVRSRNPGIRIEVLIPDMQGRRDLIDIILDSHPDILSHNFETVARLQKQVRGRGNMADSTTVLTHAKERGFLNKTSLMLGLGEDKQEIEHMIQYIAQIGVDILTLGQYLQPSAEHLPVSRFLTPEEFLEIKRYALASGIRQCASAPLVRSSYYAETHSTALWNEKVEVGLTAKDSVID